MFRINAHFSDHYGTVWSQSFIVCANFEEAAGTQVRQGLAEDGYTVVSLAIHELEPHTDTLYELEEKR